MRGERIRKKYEEDQKHVQYLLEKGWHPLEIADQMTHFAITTLREGIKQRHPQWSEERILEEMREKLWKDSQLQKKRGLRQAGKRQAGRT